MTVEELLPGTRITLEGSPLIGTYIEQTRHPLYPQLRLVVWVLSDDVISLDALSPQQEIGNPIDPQNLKARTYWLRQALNAGGR
jgi:hypothetical protein